ncbi:Ribonuclease H domain [Arabidopsis suecica]|uniref:Ribonuclease H domain n=1 Tax=Arabidopsis suecica TaxID=45249 RepID=A0A8T1ZVB2_ARASU|nr:Ribonuclease H domain [Arabidopsis suecica]
MIKINAVIECYNNDNLASLEQQIPIWTLWRIWKSRNQLLYQNLESTWQHDTIKAIEEATEWVSCWQEDLSRNATPDTFQRNSRRSHWKKPRQDFIKCNYDCKFSQNGNETRAAWIVRDSDGFFIRAGLSRGGRVLSVLEAEFQSLVMAMQHTWSQGNRRVIFEGDNQTVLKLVKGEAYNFRVHNWIREVRFWQEKFSTVEFHWTSRENNRAADRLAKTSIRNHSSFVSFFHVPSSIVNILHEDHLSH